MPEYAHEGRRELPGRKRCKVRHSERTPARCGHPRGHEGDHWFGWWPPGTATRGTVVNLDVELPVFAERLSVDAAKGLE
jgi:hypothetical protein